MEANLNSLINSGANITVSINIDDLRLIVKETIESTKKEFEKSIRDDKTETYKTIEQVTEILGVNKSTLWRWNRSGYLVHYEIGGGRRYLMSDVKALLSNGKGAK